MATEQERSSAPPDPPPPAAPNPAVQAVLGPRVFGLPGEGLVSRQALDAMDEGALLAGLTGERKSDALFRAELERKKMSPLVQIVHGLRFPGTQNADIDHALVCGDRVLLVDSKYWQPGTYTWYGESVIAGIDDQPRVIQTNFLEASNRFARLVAPAKVAAIILVHKSREGELVLDNTHRGRNAELVAAEDGLDGAINWLSWGFPTPNPTSGHDQSAGPADFTKYWQHQFATMIKVLEQQPGSPWASHRQQREVTFARQQAQAQALEAQRLASRQARLDLIKRVATYKKPRREPKPRTPWIVEFAQRREKRRQADVLAMLHDDLNSRRPWWAQKKW